MTRKRRHTVLRFGEGFKVVIGNDHSQAAQMTLSPGGCEGGPRNRHRGADQWLYVVSGRGTAIVNGKPIALTPKSLVLIERGSTHEIRNNGTTPLKTLNIYVPPAYTLEGDELTRGKG